MLYRRGADPGAYEAAPTFQHIDPQYEALAERVLRFAAAVAGRDRARDGAP